MSKRKPWKRIFTYEGVFNGIRTEDGTQAKIADINDDASMSDNDETDGVFFRFQSWIEWKEGDRPNLKREHKLFDSVAREGRRVRVIIEALD
jgi:hypothetical protein